MKSRTSSFNLTVLKKDITRFAPSWILYTVGLLLTFMISFSTCCANTTAHWMADTAFAGAIVNFCYALLNVQLLFGDLFQGRMANALHALPLRRESWFAIHTVSGLLFALVPNFLFAAIMALFSTAVPALPWLWLAWGMGTYVFFFGLAVFCATCVGSRFALAVVYGILNFASLLAAWLYDTVYLPLLYGLTMNIDPFLKLSPVCYATVNIPYELQLEHSNYLSQHPSELTMTLNPEILGYLGIITALGVIFGALALVMYRKRHLETAGDFISAPWLKPIFLVLYTVAMGIVFQWVLGLFTSTEWLYLFIGLTVGFFTGQMLLMRTTRIFVKETFIGAGMILAVTAVTLVLTALDPLGVTRWVPKAEDVAKAEVGIGPYTLEATEGEDLEQLLTYHQTALDNRDEESTVNVMYATRITYTMKDGRTAERYYTVPNLSTAYDVLEPMLHRPEVILGELYENWRTMRTSVEISDSQGKELYWFGEETWETFIEAVEKDCAEGNLIQNDELHADVARYYMLHFRWRADTEDGIRYDSVAIQIYPESTHLREWLRQQYWYDAATMEVG